MTDFKIIHCGECGIEFGVPAHFYNERRNNGGGWYCPNGHRRAFKEPVVDQLRRQRDRLKQAIAEKEDALDSAYRQVSAARGQITKLKKRASAGVCPCCNRTFQNLQRHMASKHPDFAKTEDLAE